MTTSAKPSSGPVLAIAVFGESASVALRRGDGSPDLLVAGEVVAQSHSGRMLPLVSALLARADCSPAELAGIAFEAGPGGFTSLRVACALAQGFGIALGIPVCPVGTLEAAAVSLVQARAAGTVDANEACVLVANDARMGECYFGVFDVMVEPKLCRAGFSTLLSVACATPGRVSDALAHWARQRPGLCVTGDAHRSHDDVAAELARLGITPVDAHADAAAIAMLAAGAAVEWLDPVDAAPRYVREKVALDVDEQRALRAVRP